MFSIGGYRVRFQHTNRDYLIAQGKVLKEICGVTTCKILDSETGELKIGATILCGNGENNSKNSRRKQTLAACLQKIYPSLDENEHFERWNKTARSLFWKAYSEKRGGLEDCLPKEEENVHI